MASPRDTKQEEWKRFRSLIRKVGLGKHEEQLVALCVPSLTVRASEAAMSRSRLGGLPDVPAGFEWPHGDDALTGGPEPMVFVAQLALEEVHATAHPDASRLPHAGTLAFFHGYRRGKDDQHMGSAGQVFYFEEGVTLREATAPDGGPPALARTGLTFALSDEQLPPLESPFYALLFPQAGRRSDDLYGSAARRVEALVEAHGQPRLDEADERPVHRLFGYADALQSDVYVTTEGNASGAPTSAWHTLETFRRAAGWRLLLQVDSDPGRDMLFGDLGVLAFMLRDEDLTAGRFDRVWVDWQSH